MALDSEFTAWLLSFSAQLVSRRAPAFYLEQEYSEPEAKESLQGTLRLFDFVSSFFREI